MDQQNTYQPSPVQTPTVKNAAYFRAKAREALKGVYWVALVAFLLASLLGGIPSGGVSFSSETNFNINVNSEDDIPAEFDAEIREILEGLQAGNLEPLEKYFPYFRILVAVLVFAAITSMLFSIFVGSPVAVGYQRFNLNVIDRSNVTVGVLFSYFKQGYLKTVLAGLIHGLINLLCALPMLLTAILVVAPTVSAAFANGPEFDMPRFLLTFLAIFVASIVSSVLSIVMTYRYAFARMILAEYPEIRVTDAFRNSAMLMRGKKWRLFCLHLSFIGWFLLGAFCTCGLGLLFLRPYIYASEAAFYDEIANRAAARETEFPSLNPDDYTF